MLREVDQALAEDQTSDAIRKQLPLIIGAALAVIVAVAGYQFWSHSRQTKALADSVAYEAAIKLGEGEEATRALEAIVEDGGGYGALAAMRLAGEHASHGERDKALSLYREVYSGGGATKRVKDVARMRAAYLSLSDGRDAVLKDVGALEEDETAIGFYAREIIALAALEAGDYQSAEDMFEKAASSPDAPEQIKLRASEFAALAGAGKAGVAFPEIEESDKTQSERYLEGLEQAGEDLSSIVGPAPDAADAAPAESLPDEPAAEGEGAIDPAQGDAPQTPEGNE